MIHQEALVPVIVKRFENTLFVNIVAYGAGVLLLALLAQIAIPLPWTIVPITGQTFGVTLIALAWGRLRAPAVVATYLGIGVVGLPVFASAQSWVGFGPTAGYLAGMLVSSFVVGWLADRGATNSFKRSLIAAFVGSAIVFACGLCVLSLFVPKGTLLMAGLFPFLPGDIIKMTLAAYIAYRIRLTFNSDA